MAWADFWLSRIGLAAAAGVLLLSALLVPPALAPRGEEAAAARVADEVAQKAAALAGALPGTRETVRFPEGVGMEVGSERVAVKSGPYRLVRPLLRPLFGPTPLGGDGPALENATKAECPQADVGCVGLFLEKVRAEFRNHSLKPVRRTLLLEALGPVARGVVFASEPGVTSIRAEAELRRDADGGPLQRVTAVHLGGPPLDVQGTELKVWSGKEPLAAIPLPVTAGVEGTRGVGGVFHAWNSSGPLWEPGESGWVNVARSRKALAPGDPVRVEMWNGTGLLARAEAAVEDRR